MLSATARPPLPVRLQIETTDTCNFKCIMCCREMLEGMNTRTMPLADFAKLIDAIQPFYVTLNGLGEPLIDKTIFDKLALLRRNNMKTSMPINGTYIRGEKLAQLAENLPDILVFSIDGATKESFESIRILSNFDQVIANYRAICAMKAEGKMRHGTKIQILCVLQRGNMRDFRPMYTLLRSLPGQPAFVLAPVFDFDPDGDAFQSVVPRRDEVLALQAEIDAAMAEATSDDEREFYAKWWRECVGWVSSGGANGVDPESNRAPCTVPWFNTYIDAKGRVYPCCYLTGTPQIMGNVYDDEFQEIWHGEKYTQFRHHLVNDRPSLEGCRTCPRNDDSVLRAVRRVRPLLGNDRNSIRPH
jgi:radical SAM protein with 4Fe4S-binding SPASM domain